MTNHADGLTFDDIQEAWLDRYLAAVDLIGQAGKIAEVEQGAWYVQKTRVLDRVACIDGFEFRQFVETRLHQVDQLVQQARSLAASAAHAGNAPRAAATARSTSVARASAIFRISVPS